MTHDRPPSILQIYRDLVKSGGESAYDEIERDAARICVDMNCPNSHFAIESITQPTEVWWLTPYESEAEIEQAAAGYAGNPALRAELEEIDRRKSDVIAKATNVFAHFRSDSSRGSRWRLAGTRFFVAALTKENPSNDGFVFETADSIRFVFRLASSRQQAEAIAAASEPNARVFAVRPSWGMPADGWIINDADFWSVNPAARRDDPRRTDRASLYAGDVDRSDRLEPANRGVTAPRSQRGGSRLTAAPEPRAPHHHTGFCDVAAQAPIRPAQIR